jgi:inner membrane protein
LPALVDSVFRRRLGVLFKVSGITLLILLLHIPMLMTRGVLLERQTYQAEAAADIALIWGREQSVVGPILVVPYTYRAAVTEQRVVGDKVVQVREPRMLEGRAYFLPNTLDVGGTVEPENRQRGIYEVVVYTTELRLAGSFRPDFKEAGIAAEQIDWSRAQVLIGLGDLRGLRTLAPWPGGDGAVSTSGFEPAEAAGSLALLAARADLQEAAATGGPISFDLQLLVQGSGHLNFVPAGKTTRVQVSSPWPHPSFKGAYLPVARQVEASGFTARWETSHFSRGFPGAWTEQSLPLANATKQIQGAGFGVEFQSSVDGYRLVERARKYGVLFFVLVFAVFFLFESTSSVRIHPLQYALVGAALCLFFLGFLALSEVLPTAVAYGASAVACTLMISLYAWTFLRTGRRVWLIAGGLAGTYGYLYFVLQSQDYALLAGTAALFAVLALVMYGTRSINWYAVDLAPRPAAPMPPA